MSGTSVEADADERVTVRGRSNLLLIIPMLFVLAVVISIPTRATAPRIVWVMACVAACGIATWRIVRMGVTATRAGIVVRNLGRDYHVPWNSIADITAGRSDNISGGVTTIVISRSDGSQLVGRGASAYSAAAVQRWRDRLVDVRPSETHNDA